MTTITYGLANDEYHAMPDIGSSGLREFARSPLHYWSKYRAPGRQRKDPTPLMKIGTAWHCAVFEPLVFARTYVEVPEGIDKRSKAGKELFAEIEQAGREPLTQDGMTQIKAMAMASMNSPVMQVILSQPNGVGEASFFWTDPATGVRCKIRPDYHVPPCTMFPTGLILDGKTIDDASAEAFGRSAWNAEHFLQAALYCEGFMACMGTTEPPVFAWLVQERDAPYACAIYSAAADLVEYGMREVEKLRWRIAECEQTGKWPGYPTLVQPLALPVWAQKQVEQSINEGATA
jgi:hypothetical protein